MFLRGPTKIVLPRLAYVKCELGLALAYAREHLASDALPPMTSPPVLRSCCTLRTGPE
jgi:hypothetical protein